MILAMPKSGDNRNHHCSATRGRLGSSPTGGGAQNASHYPEAVHRLASAKGADIVRLYMDDELTLQEVGRAVDANSEYVRQVLQLLGIDRRQPGGRQNLVFSPDDQGFYHDQVGGLEVCPSCGAFCSSLDARSGWCARCNENLGADALLIFEWETET